MPNFNQFTIVLVYAGDVAEPYTWLIPNGNYMDGAHIPTPIRISIVSKFSISLFHIIHC